MSSQDLSDAEAYRKLMFELAGEGDPAGAMRAMPAKVKAIIDSAGTRLRVRPADSEWSVTELLGHMLDAELVVGIRLRRTLYEDDVKLDAFDQDLWVAAQRYNKTDARPLLQALTALRPITVATWERATPEQRQRVAIHSERGPESAETICRMLAGHDVAHLEQMRRTLEAVTEPPSA